MLYLAMLYSVGSAFDNLHYTPLHRERSICRSLTYIHFLLALLRCVHPSSFIAPTRPTARPRLHFVQELCGSSR
jgi:hypothetical protein